MDNKEKNDVIEQIEYEVTKKVLQIYEQKFDEQEELIKSLTERVHKLEEGFLWAAHDFEILN